MAADAGEPQTTHAPAAPSVDEIATSLPTTPSLAHSWNRCASREMRRSLEYPLPSPLGVSALDFSSLKRYLALARPIMEDVYQFVEGSPCLIAFADSDARLLEIIGDSALQEELDAIGWTMGMCWTEECAGTNGLALALLESFPMQVVGAE